MASVVEKKKRQGKVRKLTEKFKWSPELETVFIEAVQQEECIWDYTKKVYKDRRLRHEGFKRVLANINNHSAEQAELTVDECKKKWNKLRCYFQILVNSERGRSGGEARSPPSWQNYSAMCFLKSTLNTTESFENFKRKPCTSEKVNISDESQNSMEESQKEAPRNSLEQIFLEESQQQYFDESQIEMHENEMNEYYEEEYLELEPTEDSSDQPVKENSENRASISTNSRIQHPLKKKRKVMNESDELSSALLNYLQEGREHRNREEIGAKLTANQQRGIVWGQDLDNIKNRKVLYKCIAKITSVIQEALIEDVDI